MPDRVRVVSAGSGSPGRGVPLGLLAGVLIAIVIGFAIGHGTASSSHLTRTVTSTTEVNSPVATHNRYKVPAQEDIQCSGSDGTDTATRWIQAKPPELTDEGQALVDQLAKLGAAELTRVLQAVGGR